MTNPPLSLVPDDGSRPRGIAEAKQHLQVLRSLPEIWRAGEVAARGGAEDNPGMAAYANGYAEALKSCADMLEKALPDDNDLVQYVRNLLGKFFHPSRFGLTWGTDEDAEPDDSVLRTACDTVLARIGRAAAEGDL